MTLLHLKSIFFTGIFLCIFSAFSCKEDNDILCTELTWYQDADGDGLGNPSVSISDCNQPPGYVSNNDDKDDTHEDDSVASTFPSTIDLNNLLNYENQFIPDYNNEDNTGNNIISNEGATLGRVLFYDKKLSVDNSVSCASCHKQQYAFGDINIQSNGVAGLTARHSMRLVNARFSQEESFFWDERANTLEEQTTMPIQDHIEMGYSGEDGDPGFDELIEKLSAIGYYQELFTLAFGDTVITEQRMQFALAQFVRSIQSFDSKYDQGRALVANNNAPFPNFSQLENQGKTLFMANDGAACHRCHRAPEFGIENNMLNNGVVGVIGDPTANDFAVTRSPSLRDLVNYNGESNGPMMHDGSLATIMDVINHYNDISLVPGLDPRLRDGPGGPGPGNGNGQKLELSDVEKQALEAFLKTLSGTNVYTDLRWSDPFE